MSGPLPYADTVIRDALVAFAEDLGSCNWRGKEHDCVNRFAHGFLLPHCGSTPFLRHPTQIGIDVGVAQPPGLGTRGSARKDLVIWPEPWMSCWDSGWKPGNHPLVIMEWKAIRERIRFRGNVHDHKWLAAFARWQPAFVGFSVVVSIGTAGPKRLAVARFCRTDVQEQWLSI
jgi:hypothetical protein